ncbi:MAG: lipase family protein [Bacteroidales bacterium]|nr:lipase family protein [Bacteroidales bacterium]
MRVPTWLKIVLVLVVIGGGFVVYVANSKPGRGKIIDEDARPEPGPVRPVTLIERLRAPWDSESYSDWPVAEDLATISETAYLSPVEAEVEYRKLGFVQVNTFVAASMVGHVVSADDVAVVVFRGTDDNSDWLVNLDRNSVETPHGAIHRGFHSAYQPLKPQILKLLEPLSAKHLWITGHSLGGALAVVCAYDLIENEQKSVDGIVTFGQPMVARVKLADHLDSILLGRYARFVNDADIVPRVPPSHTHCGSLVWFTGNGIKRSKVKRMVFGATPGEAPQKADTEDGPPPLSDAEFEAMKAELRAEDMAPNTTPDGKPVYKGNSPWIRDHSMGLYLNKILSLFKINGE